MIKLYVHHTTKRYLDYGDLLGKAYGVSWSSTGKACDAYGFEEGVTVTDARQRLADIPGAEDAIDLREGEPVTRSIDMNPHGLV